MTSGEAGTAVVTGASSGIGLEIVRRLLAEGYKVGFFGSSQSKVETALRQLSDTTDSKRFLGAPLDIRSPEALDAFLGQVERDLGAVSVVVNNAGISPKSDGKRIAVHDTTLEGWNDVMAVNLTGAFLCTRRLLPGMVEHRFGRIVMIGSLAARGLPRFAGAAYVASKAGLAGFVRALAAEYAAFGITANTVSPGNIATEMTGGPESAQNRAAAAAIPAGRIGLPADIAGIVAFLCKREAGFINGATIDATGAEYVAP